MRRTHRLHNRARRVARGLRQMRGLVVLLDAGREPKLPQGSATAAIVRRAQRPTIARPACAGLACTAGLGECMNRTGLLIALAVAVVVGLLFGLWPELDLKLAAPFFDPERDGFWRA